MKTAIKTVLGAVVAMLATVSCQKSIEPANPGKGLIDISVAGLMGEYYQEDATKSELVNTVRVSWKGGETVYVYDETKCLGSLVASLEGDEDRYALLSTDDEHTVSTPAEGTTKLTLVHSPLLTEAPSVSNGTISISLAEQNNPKAPFVAYATLDYTGTTITNAIVPFKFATSVIKVNCTGLKANTAITSASLSYVNTVCNLTLSKTDAPSVKGTARGNITITGDTNFAADKINGEGEAVFQIAVPELGKVSLPERRFLTVIQDSEKYKDKDFTTKTLGVATSVNTVCQLCAAPAGGLPGMFYIGEMTNDVIYISSGNLYWDGNSFKIEDNQYDKVDSWDPHHVSHFYWSKSASTAYAEEYRGESATTNDVFFTNAAGFTVNINGKPQEGWRTLSAKEWKFLLLRQKHRWTKVHGVYGLVLAPPDFTGKIADSYDDDDDLDKYNLVFFPAAGRRNMINQFKDSELCMYWTSSAADIERMDEDGVYTIGDDRDTGSCIRLVKTVE